MDPEPVTPTAPRPLRRTVLTQDWADVTFLHWAVEPAAVARLLPPGTRPDLFEGRTYVGLIPFRMRGLGLLGSPGLPWVGSFLETNVRLYSVDEEGRRGVVFRSLDADRLPAVLGGRWGARLPYCWSRMTIARNGTRLTYTSRRRWPGPRGARTRVDLRIGDRLDDPGELARFLTSRWGLHREGRGRTAYWPNEHPPWPLHTAELLACDEDVLSAGGLPGVTGPPDSVLFSPGVAGVRFDRPLRPASAPSRPSGRGVRWPRGSRRRRSP